MRSVNKVIIVGHLASEPDARQTKGGHDVVSFPVATNRNWHDSDGKEHEVTDYHRIVAWRGLGKSCGEYLRKGSGVYVEGRLTNRKYTDKQGAERFTTEITADVVNFITYNRQNDAEHISLVEVKS